MKTNKERIQELHDKIGDTLNEAGLATLDEDILELCARYVVLERRQMERDVRMATANRECDCNEDSCGWPYCLAGVEAWW